MKSTPNQAPLLDRHARLRSIDVCEIEHAVPKIFGARRFEVMGRQPKLKVHANYWRGSAVALSFCHQAGAATELSFSDATYFRQYFAIRGNIDLKVDQRHHSLSSASSCMVPADRPLKLRTDRGFDHLVLRIDRAFLARKIKAMTGKSIARFNADSPLQSCPVGSAQLERLIRYLASELNQENTPGPFLSEIEQALAVAFLSANPCLLETALPETFLSVGSNQLRAAEEYIAAHWDQPLTLEGLAAVTRSSTRSLFHHFRQSRGKSPMQYLKEVRLKHARHMLQNAVGGSVTEVAFACGFGNLGHFARDYRRAWGELPSDTRRAHSEERDSYETRR